MLVMLRLLKMLRKSNEVRIGVTAQADALHMHDKLQQAWRLADTWVAHGRSLCLGLPIRHRGSARLQRLRQGRALVGIHSCHFSGALTITVMSLLVY